MERPFIWVRLVLTLQMCLYGCEIDSGARGRDVASIYGTVASPHIGNVYLDGLLGPAVYNLSQFTSGITYVLQGRAGSNGMDGLGGSLWSANGASKAFVAAAEAWKAVSNIPLKASPFYYNGSGTTSANWIEKYEFLGTETSELGYHELPTAGQFSFTFQINGGFNSQSPVFTRENNAIGGYSFTTFLHEIGHALGLDHPHDSALFPGVTSASSLGDFGLNQGLFTVMSYNDGYAAKGDSPSLSYGWMSTPGAFDIALVQSVYGVNTSTHASEDVYYLPASNQAGTSYSCIWDAGGNDTISAENIVLNCTIDLRAATLLRAPGGGGWLSSVEGVFGGFTIANGAVIENAIGGAGNDTLTGNTANNILSGGSGNDEIYGGAGDDRLIGGEGIDTALYTVMRSQVTISRNADGTLTINAGIEGIDVVGSVERLRFSDGIYQASQFSVSGGVLVNNFAVGAGGWSSQDLHPRHIADVNGDGFSDIVGFGQSGVLVSFGALNGTFSNAATVVSNFGQTAGWSSDNLFHRELADVNGDGRADIVGFGIAGTLVSVAKGDGSFDNPGTGIENFGANQGWSTQDGFARTVGDVNGDGNADLVGFGYAGTLVSLGNGDGTFRGASLAVANFGVEQGWSSDNLFHRIVADVNGDGADDILGFGYAGTLVALSNGDGTFGQAQLALTNFGKNQGWASQDAFARDAADVNGDSYADIVGFGVAGTYVAYGQANGSFSTASFDLDNFGANQGWLSDTVYHRELADIDNDGLNDIVGFGFSGVLAGYNQSDWLV